MKLSPNRIIKILKNNKFNIFLLILLIVAVIYLGFYVANHKNRIIDGFETTTPSNKNIEIVVSRYNENLEWVNKKPFSKYPVICYNKGINDNFKVNNLKKVVELENVGRESHTYLYHIINNYHDLADITLFLPGSADSSVYNKFDRTMKLIKECEKSNTSVIIASKQKNVKNENYDFYLGEYLSTTDENKKINDDPSLELSKIRPYGKWFDTYFPNVDIQYITYSGIIAISKKHIQQHPINYYKMLIDQLSNSSNPEVGHYFERSWVAVFHPMTDAKFIES